MVSGNESWKNSATDAQYIAWYTLSFIQICTWRNEKRKKKKRGKILFFQRSLGINSVGEETFHIALYPLAKERTEVNLRIWKSYPKETVKMFSDLRQRAKHMPKECFLGLYSFTVSAEADATKIQGAAETVV